MKRHLRYLLLLLLALALVTVKTFSQQVDAKQTDEALRQKAYKVLESLANEIGSLKSGENRARMGSNIARSIWPHNEARAREMFATVTKEIKAGLAKDEDSDFGRYRARPKFVKMREDTALRIGMFDPEWAVKFLEETTPTDIKISDKKHDELILQLAMVVAGRNPDLALKLGRETLNHGVSEMQLPFIYELNKKSRADASKFLTDMVKIAPHRDIRHALENEQIYLSLARLVEPTMGTDPAFRDLMKYFTDLALEAGCGNKNYRDSDGFCYRIGILIPFMERVDAKRVAPLRHLTRKGGFPYEWSPELTQYAEVYQDGSVDDLLAMIPQFPEFRDAGQSFVIRKLLAAGDFERARKFANEFTWTEPSLKEELAKAIDAAQRVVNEDTSPEILRIAALSREEDAFNLLFRKATQIGARNPQTTVKLLDAASELWSKVPPQRGQVQYQIGIAIRYCQVKSERCFTMMESIIRKLNELVSAAAILNDFDNYYLDNGEWNMTAEGGVGSLLTMLAQNAVYFALCDFDRALALSTQFERREIRMMAQLKLAQGVLDGPPRKPLFAEIEQ
ncbi:MAG TPA: hypothetical protein VN659_14500 [Pyrinomonadaceae bacterium]|nr:hypothetical protein [Pyrinomonadaceae bacterium]